jgi:hypothetical protein
VTKEAGLLHEGTRWGSGCAFLDYNRDGFPDIFVANYLEFNFEEMPGGQFVLQLEGCSRDVRPEGATFRRACAVPQ